LDYKNKGEGIYPLINGNNTTGDGGSSEIFPCRKSTAKLTRESKKNGTKRIFDFGEQMKPGGPSQVSWMVGGHWNTPFRWKARCSGKRQTNEVMALHGGKAPSRTKTAAGVLGSSSVRRRGPKRDRKELASLL